MGKAKASHHKEESVPEPSPPSPRRKDEQDGAQSEAEVEEVPVSQNDRMKARMEKLAQLRKKIVGVVETESGHFRTFGRLKIGHLGNQDESQAANRQDVYAEHQKQKENPREAAKLERKRAQAQELLEKKTAEEEGVDYDRKDLLKYTAEDVERWEKRQQEKAERANTGMTDFGQMAAKAYNKQVKELKPNLTKYEEQKSLAAVSAAISSNRDESDFYRDANSMAYANLDNKPDADGVERMVAAVKDKIAARSTFSRRRTREDDDVTYINDRNMRFNKKVARAYDKYTSDIKASFERGTALD